MQKQITILLLCLSLISFSQENKVSVNFHKNIEFFGYVVHLGDPGEDDPNHPVSKILSKYDTNKDNPILGELFEKAADMDYAFFINLCYYLPEFPITEETNIEHQLRLLYSYKTEEEIQSIKEIVTLVNKFYMETQFDRIWDELETHRNKVKSQLQENLPSNELLSQIESVYELDFDTYKITPSLTIWSSPGWGFPDSDLKTANFVLGPLDKNFDFTDGAAFENLAIHEFGHCFVNSAVLKNQPLIDETRPLFASLKSAMHPQGYNDWEGCLIEHFVRAGEVIIPESMGDNSQTQELMTRHVDHKKFKYMPFIIDKLNYYRFDKSYSYEKAVKLTIRDLKLEHL